MITTVSGIFKKENSFASGILNNKLFAVLILFFTAVAAFSVPAATPYIFINALIILLLQIFSTFDYYKILKYRNRALCAENNIQVNEIHTHWITAVGLAIRDGFFLIFFCFDIIWFLSAYINPNTVQSFNEYLSHLRFGPVSGLVFIIFTLLLFYIYLVLFLMAGEDYKKIFQIDKVLSSIEKIHFSIATTNHSGEKILINGFRIPNPGRQPLILCPGFYQNGYYYDIHVEEESLSEYLWKSNYDIWVYHPRGTGFTGYSRKMNTLDDYASEDIPSVIEFVKRNTGLKPIFMGHSQGGITALMSMMGADKDDANNVILSDKSSIKRQDNLKALITLGSYPDFTFSKPAMAKELAVEGINLKISKTKYKLISPSLLLGTAKLFNRLPVPVPIVLRRAMIRSLLLRIVLFPLTLILNFVSLLKIWEFLYVIPNVSKKSRKILFYDTIQATFSGILFQFSQAVVHGKMQSYNKSLNYSENYSRIKLPVVIVTMEHDSLAHPPEAQRIMFPKIGSTKKFFVEWKGQGHEDFVMDSKYFSQVLDAIKLVA